MEKYGEHLYGKIYKLLYSIYIEENMETSKMKGGKNDRIIKDSR